MGQDIGFVGDIVKVDTKVIEFLLGNKYIPVISPIGIGEDNKTYSINADSVAASIAISVGATRVLFFNRCERDYEKWKTSSSFD